MPWDVKKIAGKYCVVKSESGDKAGCHDTRGEAVDQLRALYASEAASASNIEFNIGLLESAIEHLKLALVSDPSEIRMHVKEALKALGEKMIDKMGPSEDDMHGDEDTEYMLRKKRYSYSEDTEEFASDLEEYAWEGPIVFENEVTGDNRMFRTGAIQWEAETLPWAFRWQKASGQGHAGSVPVGRVDRIERREDGSIYGYGVVIPGLSEEAAEYLKLLQSGAGGGVSVDGDSAQFDVQESVTKDSPPRIEFSSMRLRALSAVDIPAFNGARIRLVEPKEEEAVVASTEFAEDGAPCKKESAEKGEGCFPKSDYAYTPSDNVSEWKLRLTATPGGDPDPGIVGAAIAALGKGFRGNKVEIPAEDLASVKAKVEAAWKEANSDKDESEMPSFETYEHVEFVTVDDIQNTVAAEVFCDDKPHFDPRQELAKKKKKRNKKAMGAYSWKFDEALVASAIPTLPSTEYFVDPEFEEPTALTVTRDGKVFGHLALFNTCHIGFPGTCVKPPKGSDYRYFHTGQIETAEGDLVDVGHLTFGTGHADMKGTARGAAEHYDNTGTVAADVRCGEDEFGIWVVGALRPGLTEEQIREFRAAPLSGDWRKIAGRLELVGALAVNVPGFPVPRVRAMVASGDTEALLTFLESDDEAFIPEEELRASAKAELAFRMGVLPKELEAFEARLEQKEALALKLGFEFADGALDKLMELPPEDVPEDFDAFDAALEPPKSPTRKDINSRAAKYKNDLDLLKNDLKLLRELLDDEDEKINKTDRKNLEDLYDALSMYAKNPKKITDSVEMTLEDAIEFYNTCHSEEDGRFCEGPDGPGRLRDKPGRGAARYRDDNRGRSGDRGRGGSGDRGRSGDNKPKEPGKPGPGTYRTGNKEPANINRFEKKADNIESQLKDVETGKTYAPVGVSSNPNFVDNYRVVRNHYRLARNWATTAALATFAKTGIGGAIGAGLVKGIPALGILLNPAVTSALIVAGLYYTGKNIKSAITKSRYIKKESDFLRRLERYRQNEPVRPTYLDKEKYVTRNS